MRRGIANNLQLATRDWWRGPSNPPVADFSEGDDAHPIVLYLDERQAEALAQLLLDAT